MTPFDDKLHEECGVFGIFGHDQAAAHVASRPGRWAVGAGILPLSALLSGLDALGAVRRSPFLSSFTTGFVVLARKG